MKNRGWLIPLILLLATSPTLASCDPESRIGSRMIYDPVDQRIILYGGGHWDNGYTLYGELWSYESETNTWTIIEAENKPDARFNTMITYLPEKHQLFLFGGWSHEDRIADTWIYDFASSTWTELHPVNQPSRRSDASIAYNPENDVVVLYSGYLLNDTHKQDTWIYSFAEANWLKQHPENPPLCQYGHYMVYSEETGQLLMYPGHWSIWSNGVMQSHGFGGNIWEYDVVEETWTEHQSTPTPPGRYWGNIVYDTQENRIILFGGNGATDYDDTWTYDIEDQTWERATQTNKPPKRGCFGMVYDPENHIAVIFGGFSESAQSLGDTWILDCETLTWSQPETHTIEETQTETTTTRGIPGFPATTVLLTITLVTLMKRTHTFKKNVGNTHQ